MICFFFQNYEEGSTVHICSTCFQSIRANKVPIMARINGFKYPERPPHLPELDIITERLVSPRLPFLQVKRLRWRNQGQYGVKGQICNVPVNVNSMVKLLPRKLDDDFDIYVNIQKLLTSDHAFYEGLINKDSVKKWLRYLVEQPLYQYYEIKIDDTFFNNTITQEITTIPDDIAQQIFTQENCSQMSNLDDLIEAIPIDEIHIAQQETLLWNEDLELRLQREPLIPRQNQEETPWDPENRLVMAPGANERPISLLLDQHAEELSFPQIYLGQFREFTVPVTPFSIASSELRRADRRGVVPTHLLYAVVRLLRLRMKSCISVSFKHSGYTLQITKEMIEDPNYLNKCFEHHLAFLKCIPNSAFYWADKKKDLFAMIRQLGKPTFFLTVSANEIRWLPLLRILYKLKHKVTDVSDDIIKNLTAIEKNTLVNEDAVTCAIYFNKLVNVLLSLLQSKNSPFGKYRVCHYFRRTEFQQRGSAHEHILLWCENAPKDVFNKDHDKAIDMIDSLISVSAKEASGNVEFQTHNHTFTCWKKVKQSEQKKCRFGAPFFPMRTTKILLPMKKDESNFRTYRKKYLDLRAKLDSKDITYKDIDDFYEQNDINTDQDYFEILRAGITRPRVFLKRQPSEKNINPFNPFIFHIIRSNMDLQFVTEQYSLAQYVVDYVNKSDRGMSNLTRSIVEAMAKDESFNLANITQKITVGMLNGIEICSQEAAWILLRQAMAKSSVAVVYIPTFEPCDRQRIKKTMKELAELDDESTNIWKENWFDKYEKRPEELNDITLAQFVSTYTYSAKNKVYNKRAPRVIRYRNYDITDNFANYKREMVTLHIPFRNEMNEIILDNKYNATYECNKDLILERKKQFESDIDVDKLLQLCDAIIEEENSQENSEHNDVVEARDERNPYDLLMNDPNSAVNEDLRAARLKSLSAVVKKRENMISKDEFIELMRMATQEQKEIALDLIYHLQHPSSDHPPFQIFLSSAAGCGKTWLIKLFMAIYNRYGAVDSNYNAYIACASTGKAAVNLDGVTVHSALGINQGTFMPLSFDKLQLFQSIFDKTLVLIVDEVSMVSSTLLNQINNRLQHIRGSDHPFGGLDVIFVGDLRQLPPVRSQPIFRPVNNLSGAMVWRSLKPYFLTKVIRQQEGGFSSLLTKLGDGKKLSENELKMIEDRFFMKEDADRLCPHGIRLFFTNVAVTEYNNAILNRSPDKIICKSQDTVHGCCNDQQHEKMIAQLSTMDIADTGHLPNEIIFVLETPYMITSNIEVADGLANGEVGTLKHVEIDENGTVRKVWLRFREDVGKKKKLKHAGEVQRLGIDKNCIPIVLRSANITLDDKNQISAKRQQFPIKSALSMTIHKAQGGTFEYVVYEYDGKHNLRLVYVALTRVTAIEGLYLVTKDNTQESFIFHHGRRSNNKTVAFKLLEQEMERLKSNKLKLQFHEIRDVVSKPNVFSFITLNCQSLRNRRVDFKDEIYKRVNLLLLSETKMKPDENFEIENFTCVAKKQRADYYEGGVAIYRNVEDEDYICSNFELAHQPDSPNLELPNYFNVPAHNDLRISKEGIGEVCASHITLKNGQVMVFASIYLSPRTSYPKIQEFLGYALLPLCDHKVPFLQSYHKLPLILAGDFNYDFSSESSNQLRKFLKDIFNLDMISDAKIPTRRDYPTQKGHCIDAVFSRYINRIKSEVYVSYFSDHKPIISTIEIEDIVAIE